MTPREAVVQVEDLQKIYESQTGKVRALRGITLGVEEGEFFTLLGPSGCGKTTMLRCMAGLERPDNGNIFIGGKEVFSSDKKIFVMPYKRDIGMVFQSYAIWPHMNVFNNVAFPLRNLKESISRKEITQRVQEALRKVQLDGLEQRSAPQLSGGQQQRLALARALVKEPHVLLLDEPLSNLDARLREGMRVELRNLVRRLGITTVYVTHDQLEAMTMSDRVAVMKDGEVVQIDNPLNLYTQPKSRFVAEFVGIDNFFEGVVTEKKEGDFCTLSVNGIKLLAKALAEISIGEKGTLAIRPEAIQIIERAEGPNCLTGTVHQAIFVGEFLDCHVRVGEKVVHVKTNPLGGPSEGKGIVLRLPPESCCLIKE